MGGDKMSCCPAGSLLMLGEEGYQPKGKVVRVEDLDIYVVGNGEKCVTWNYDIFGFNSGRTKELADLLAESGFLVVMPDYFRGTFQDPTKPGALEFLQRTTQWTNIEQDWKLKIKPPAIPRSVWCSVNRKKSSWKRFVILIIMQ